MLLDLAQARVQPANQDIISQHRCVTLGHGLAEIEYLTSKTNCPSL